MGNRSILIIGVLVMLSYALATPTTKHAESTQKQTTGDLGKDEQAKLEKLASNDHQEPIKLQGEKPKEPQKNNEGNEAIDNGSKLNKDVDSTIGDDLSSADFDDGFESILKDVLITLRDNPGIIKDIIDGEEKEEQYNRLPGLMDFQNPPPQLELAPKRVEKKAGSKQFMHRTQSHSNEDNANSDESRNGEYYKNKYAHSSESSDNEDGSSENYYKMKYGQSSSESTNDQSNSRSEDDSSSHESHVSESSEGSDMEHPDESSHHESSSSVENEDSNDSDLRIRNVKRVPEEPEETIDLTTFAVQRRSMYNNKRGKWQHPPHSMNMNLRQRSYNSDTRAHPDPRKMLHHSLLKNNYMTLPSMRAPKMMSRTNTGNARNRAIYHQNGKFARGQLENNLKAIKQHKIRQGMATVKRTRLRDQQRVGHNKPKTM